MVLKEYTGDVEIEDPKTGKWHSAQELIEKRGSFRVLAGVSCIFSIASLPKIIEASQNIERLSKYLFGVPDKSIPAFELTFTVLGACLILKMGADFFKESRRITTLLRRVDSKQESA
jgi:hypothetical protein